MTRTFDKVLQAAFALPTEERRCLGETLLDTVPLQCDAEIEKAWNQAAIDRAERFERGEIQALDGEDALRGLETKLARIHGQ